MKKIALAVIMPLIMSGCAYQSTETYERPDGKASSEYPNKANQTKISSASHWQLLAENEAKLLKQRFTNNPIYIEQHNSSNFSDTYFNLLSSSLVSNGAQVLLTNDNSKNINVSYKVNVVNNNWGKQPPEFHVRTVHGIVVNYILAGVPEILQAPIQLVKDKFIKNLSTTTEVIITTQATRNNQLLYSASNVYFIEGINQDEYRGADLFKPSYKAGEVRTISLIGNY
jgi:hypothetical protein